MLKIISLFIFVSTYCHSFMFTKTSSGNDVKWKKRNSQILLFLNPESKNFSNSEVSSIVQDSVSSWNQVSPNTLLITNSSSQQSDGAIQFTQDPRYFSNGVIAVTKTSYQENSGIIYNASILINESLSQQSLLTNNKSLSANGFAYLGDILTHELGHLIGLSHSEVYDSSMIFSVFKNQHDISSDDIQGVKSLYNSHVSSNQIKGKVTAGDQVGVFGAHVQLISLKDNKIVAGTFTDITGNFTFTGLDSTQQYILYMDKIKSSENLDASLAKSSSRYCSGNSFKPSFYSSCDRSKKGESTILGFSSKSIVDVGNFTIRCTSQVKSSYLLAKSESKEFELALRGPSFTHTGYFSENEIESIVASTDKYYIDLRAKNLSPLDSASLRLNFMAHKLGSAFAADVLIKNVETGSELIRSYQFDPVTGRIESEVLVDVNLSSNTNENHFEIYITPISMTNSQKQEVFAISSVLTNDVNLYHLTGQLLINGIVSDPEQFYQDNSSCEEGDTPYVLTESISGTTNTPIASTPMSCATVDLESNGSNNLFSMMLGFMAIFFLVNFKNHLVNFLSK